ncbi:hypothetical protein A4A49_58297, partial [Nicotiana attenuata]
IMMMNPSPDIDRAYFLLLQEEMQRSIQPLGNYPRNTANGLKNNQTQHQDYKRSTSTNLICRYCKKPGHTIEKCYKIHGYPLNFKNSRPRPFNNHAHSNATSTQEDTQSQASDVSIGIKQEQLNQLTELLQQVKFGQQGPSSSEANATANCAGIHSSFLPLITSKTHFWILDSGASEHMTFDASILLNIEPLSQPIYV